MGSVPHRRIASRERRFVTASPAMIRHRPRPLANAVSIESARRCGRILAADQPIDDHLDRAIVGQGERPVRRARRAARSTRSRVKPSARSDRTSAARSVSARTSTGKAIS